MKRAQKREHLINVAAELFNRQGYHAAGVDQVITEAGIAKTTLYRHFKSKEGLIVAVLQSIAKRFRDDMREAVSALTSKPQEQLLATFDFLENWFKNPEFFGCPFLSAASEFNDRSGLVFQEARVHKRLMVAYFEELARAAELNDPQKVAEEIHLLHEGATAVAHISGDPSTARKAKESATKIVDEASI